MAFFLEAPGETEINMNTPLCGSAGHLWEYSLLSATGLNRREVFVGNTLRCRPPDNKFPTGELGSKARAHCRAYDRLHSFAQHIRIDIDNPNAQKLLPIENTNLFNERHVCFEHQECGIVGFKPDTFLVTEHPAVLIRAPYMISIIRAHLEKAARLMAKGRRVCVLMGGVALLQVAPHLTGGIKKWMGHFWYTRDGWPFKEAK